MRPAVALLTVLLALTGCSRVLPGRASAAVPPGSPTVAIAAPAAAPPRGSAEISVAAAAALQEYWRGAFPAAFGKPWADITAFVPVATDDADTPPPPCVRRAAELAGQAFYCPTADAVVWDADGLVPDLRDRFGAAGIAVVLAHEVGHAVQTRLGIDDAQRRDPARYPTILLEAMADCYAGDALAHLADGPLAVGLVERDDALRALVGFRDPLGIAPGDGGAHGNAFDRVSAFQDGYSGGARRCAAMSVDNRAFTERRFGSAADRARGGDLPLTSLLTAVGSDARTWFGSVVATRTTGWQAPALRTTDSTACPAAELVAQGPVRFCDADGTLAVDRSALAPLHQQLGDYAGATLVASRYGLAALAALGVATDEPAAGAAATCLAGAYTGRLLDTSGGFSLSPGDLDEAVQVLLAGDWAGRDARGNADRNDHGFERVGRFRTGLLGGPAACLPAA